MSNGNHDAAYDVIGDIHGHGDELIALLAKLGYYHDGASYKHESRKVLFLGDFVDRGPRQKLVLDTVMAMCNHGAAEAIMGNHEFNALAYHTEHPADSKQWLRPHTEKNTRQHRAFLDEYLSSPDELKAVLDWFMTLPLWRELPGGLRAVHACWYTPAIERLSPLLGPNNTLTEALLIESSNPDEQAYEDVENLLKGRELRLPHGITFSDKDGITRRNIRIRWWRNNPGTLADIAQPPYVVERNPQLADIAMPADLEIGYDETEVPVLFGHYWFEGTPKPEQPNVACLDYSVPRKTGKLVAYRWSGEQVLKPANFVAVGNMKASA